MTLARETESLVLSEIALTLDGKAAIGRITLNSPKTLNALNLEIILTLQEMLHAFEKDKRIVAVFIEGAGDKAFCAGGDVKSIRQRILEMRGRGQSPVPLARVFFENEYKLDLAIHTYSKPIVIWGDGITMGGGIGLLAGASHRVVTESSVLAMPEVTIGLYPDVGASYFLPRMPGLVGLFLGMTATRLRAADALFVGLADHYVPRANKELVWRQLLAARYQGDVSAVVTNLLRASGEGQTAAPSILEERRDEIDRLMDGASVQTIVDRFRLIGGDDPFLQQAKAALLNASPTSLGITFEQYRRSAGISLQAAFEQETRLSVQCCDRHDFVEGVRALLVDKDNQAQWRPSSIEQVNSELIEEHFREPLVESSGR